VKSERGPWIAVSAAALLGLFYWGWEIEWKPLRAKRDQDAKLLFKGLDAANTREILLRKKGAADVLLRKIDDQWRLITPTAAPADGEAVKSLLTQLAGAMKEQVVVDKDADMREFGLDDPSGAVTFKPTSPNAKAGILYFGMDSPDGNQTYGNIQGQTDVFLTYMSVKNAVLKDAGALRDKTLWTFTPSDVESLRSDIGRFSLAHGKDGTWVVNAPDRQEPAKGEQVDSWLQNLASLKADSVPSETGKGKFDLEKGHRLSLTLKNGTTLTLIEGAKVTRTTGVYTQLAGAGPVFQLPPRDIGILEKAPQELMDLNVLSFRTGEVQRMEIQREKSKLVAVKKSGVWSWEPPLEVKPGQKTFDFYSFISALANAQLLKRLDPKADQPKKPEATVTLFGEDGGLLEKAEFGGHRDKGQVVVSAMKNQTVIAASNLLDGLPPDRPMSAAEALSATAAQAIAAAAAQMQGTPAPAAAPTAAAVVAPVPKP
jgi:hypothetical protein